MAKNKIKSGRDMVILTTLIIAITASILLIIFPPFTLTGAFSASGSNWENKIAVSATSDQQSITKHIVFGENKPITCAAGIYIEASSKEIPFKTTNEVYDEHSGVCSETDVVFDNVIYQAPAPQPAPPENGGPAPNLGISETQTITYDIYYGKIAEELGQPGFQIQTDIGNCTNITLGGSYVLNQSITGVQPGKNKCIDIQANNVLLDCAGYSLTHNNSAGSIGIAGNGTNILFSPLRNVTIQNCSVSNYSIGIALNVTDGGKLENNVLTSNTDAGIKFVDTRNINLTNNDAEFNTMYGIYSASQSNNFTNNIANLNGIDGIYIHGEGNTVDNNNASLNGQYGIYLESYNPFAMNYITNNNASYNNETGIYLIRTTWNYIDYNFANNNTDTGIALEYVNSTELTGNTINLNGGDGVRIEYGKANSITGNIISNSTSLGISLMSAINTTIDSNTISSDNGWDFQSWTGCSGTLATNNTFGSSFPTTTNFTYSGQIEVRGVASPSTDPDNYTNISKYIEAIDIGSGAWIALNISYSYADLGAVNESTLNISKFVSGWDTNTANFANHYGVNTGANYVYANITSFGSVFAPLGINQALYVGLNLPANNTQFNSTQNIDFNFTATGNGNTTFSCDIYLDDVLNQTNGSVANYTLTDFLINGIDYGDHNWYVNCTDGTLSSVSETRYFSVTRQITNCMNITTPGAYTLASDLTGVQPGSCLFWRYCPCIDIQANDVILDCEGHNLNYDDSNYTIGIISYHNNVTINNCTMSNYEQGLFTFNVTNFVIANTTANDNKIGIFITNSSNNNLTNDTANDNSDSGIVLRDNVANNILIGNNASNNNNNGFYLRVGHDNTFVNNTFNENNYGINIDDSPGTNNNFTSNTANSNNYGTYIQSSYNDYFTNNIFNNNNVDGICLITSNNFTFTNNTAENNTRWAFNSTANSRYNIVTNLEIGSTNVSFKSKDIALRNGTNPGSSPVDLYDIGKFVNATNTSASSWLYLNVSYADPGDLGLVDENTLNMSKYNSTSGGIWYTDPSAFANAYGVDTANDYVYANITNFGSTFAPLGSSAGAGAANCINITASGYNSLLNNLIGVQPGRNVCVDIQVDDVVFDCAGHNIIGNSSGTTYGIYTNSSNTTIVNCTVQNYTYGIDLNHSSYGNLTSNTANNNIRTGICLNYSSHDILTNNTASASDEGISLYDSLNNTLVSNVAYNNSNYGIELSGSAGCNSSNLTSNIANNNYVGIYARGINNTFVNNTFNDSSTDGFSLQLSSNTVLINNTISNNAAIGVVLNNCLNTNLTNNSLGSNTNYDFVSQISTGTLAINNTISSYPTTVSFTYNGDIGLTGVTDPPFDEPHHENIGKYVNATKQTSNAWLFLNISYNQTEDVDSYLINESRLNMSKYNSTSGGTWYTDPSAFANTYGVDTANDYVYANITNFGSIFAPLGPLSPCNLTALVNGAETNFTNAAEPVNVTVDVTTNGHPRNRIAVQAHEYNGYTFFVMPQLQDSNVSNDVFAEVATGGNGLASMTLVPTGARYVNKSILGDYNITFTALCLNTTKTLYVTNTEFPEPSGPSISIPNAGQIASLKTEVLRVYDRAKGWLALGGGEHKDVTLTAGTFGTELFQAVAGKPYAINLTVTGGSGENVRIVLNETEGYPPFALPQSADSTVSNVAEATLESVPYGVERHLTIIPTGGRYSPNPGSYGVWIYVYNSSGMVASGYVNVTDRNLPEPSGSQQALYNQGNLESLKTEILRIYDRIKGWLSL
jgi:parallel beta-helix repeat protein